MLLRISKVSTASQRSEKNLRAVLEIIFEFQGLTTKL